MGVKHLWKLVNSAGVPVRLEDLARKKIAVDVSIWMARFVKAIHKSNDRQTRNAHLQALFHRCLKLLYYGMRPIFVFDGERPALKRSTLEKRRMARWRAEAKFDEAARTMVLNKLKQEAIRRISEALEKEEGKKKGTKGKGPALQQSDEEDGEEDCEDSEKRFLSGDLDMSRKVQAQEDAVMARALHEELNGRDLSAATAYARATKSAEVAKVVEEASADLTALESMTMEPIEIDEDEEAEQGEIGDKALANLQAEMISDWMDMEIDLTEMEIDLPVFRCLPMELQQKLLQQLNRKKRGMTGLQRMHEDDDVGALAQALLKEGSAAPAREATPAPAAPAVQAVVEDSPVDFSVLQMASLVQRGKIAKTMDDMQRVLRQEGSHAIASQPNRMYKHRAPHRTTRDAVFRESADDEDLLMTDAQLEDIAKARGLGGVEYEEIQQAPTKQATIEAMGIMFSGSDSDRDDAPLLPSKRVREQAETEKRRKTDDQGSTAQSYGEVIDLSLPGPVPGDAQTTMEQMADKDLRKQPIDEDPRHHLDQPPIRSEAKESLDTVGNGHEDEEGFFIELDFGEGEEEEHDDLFLDVFAGNAPSSVSQVDRTAEFEPPAARVAACTLPPKQPSIGPAVDSCPAPVNTEQLCERSSVLVDEVEESHSKDSLVVPSARTMSAGDPEPIILSDSELLEEEGKRTIESTGEHCDVEVKMGCEVEKEKEFEEPEKILMDDSEDEKSRDYGQELNKEAETGVSEGEPQARRSEGNRDKSHLERSESHREQTRERFKDSADTARFTEGASVDKSGSQRSVELHRAREASHEGQAMLPTGSDELFGSQESVASKESEASQERFIGSQEGGGSVHGLDSSEERDTDWTMGSQNSVESITDLTEGSQGEQVPASTIEWQEPDEETSPQRRAKALETIQQQLEEEARSLSRQARQFASTMASVGDELSMSLRVMLGLFGFPFVTAPCEAEAQCAELYRLGMVDGVVSDDSDTLLFGGKVYKNLFNRKEDLLAFHLATVDIQCGLTREQLVELAMLLGCDYTDGVRGVGPKTAILLLDEFGSVAAFREWYDLAKAWLDAAEEEASDSDDFDEDLLPDVDSSPVRRKLFRMLQRGTLQLEESFPSELVRQAYMQPRVDSSKEEFRWLPADEEALVDYAVHKFQWNEAHARRVIAPAVANKRQRISPWEK